MTQRDGGDVAGWKFTKENVLLIGNLDADSGVYELEIGMVSISIVEGLI